MRSRHVHRLWTSRGASGLPWLLAAVLSLPLPPAARAADKPRQPPPAASAETYPFHETHEGITVAAEPGDTEATRPNTRLDYFHHGFLPVRVIVTNNGTQPLSLDQARILFIASDGYTRNAATDEELQRRMFSTKSAAGTRIPLPMPLPSITIHHPPVAKQILADDHDFGFATTVVAPHTTVAGYLFYDTRDMDDPVLDHATLELRRAHWDNSTADLMAFQIPLQPAGKAATSPGAH